MRGRGPYYQRIREYEKMILIEALKQFDGNKRYAARALGLKETTLKMKLKSLGIAEDFRKFERDDIGYGPIIWED